MISRRCIYVSARKSLSSEAKIGSHNQSFGISFRRVRAAEKREISSWLHYPDNSRRVRGPKHNPTPSFSFPLPSVLLLLHALLLSRKPPLLLSFSPYRSFLSFKSHLTKLARFLEPENHIRFDAACILPFSIYLVSSPSPLSATFFPSRDERPMHV